MSTFISNLWLVVFSSESRGWVCDGWQNDDDGFDDEHRCSVASSSIGLYPFVYCSTAIPFFSPCSSDPL